MSINLPAAVVTLFDSEVKQEYQGGTVLSPYIKTKSVEGKTYKFRRMGLALARQKNIHDDVVPSNVQHFTPEAVMQDWHASDYTDIFLNGQVNFDERQELAKALGMAVGRRRDKIVIDALNAGALAGNTVSVDVGGTASDMNFAKFLEMNKILDNNDVPRGTNRTFLMNWRAYSSLMRDEEFTSSDFTMRRRYDGDSMGAAAVMPFLDFNIVCISDRIESDGATTGLPRAGDVVSAFGFDRDAIGMASSMDNRSEINYIPNKLAHLATAMFSAGSTVIDAKGVAKVNMQQPV